MLTDATTIIPCLTPITGISTKPAKNDPNDCPYGIYRVDTADGPPELFHP